MVKLTTDTLESAPINNNQSQTRKARHPIPVCKCEAIYAIPACKLQTSYPRMHSKSHCIKWTSCGSQINPMQRISRANTTTPQEARQGIRFEA